MKVQNVTRLENFILISHLHLNDVRAVLGCASLVLDLLLGASELTSLYLEYGRKE